MQDLAIRFFMEETEKRKKSGWNNFGGNPEWRDENYIFAFDTETTNDIYQNLKFGSSITLNDNRIEKICLFYDPNFVSDCELKYLENHCMRDPTITLLTVKDWIEKIFYPTVYTEKAVCCGFNLAFDISRLSTDFHKARKSMLNGFSLALSENEALPRIRIKHVDSPKTFFRFSSALDGNFNGFFVDLHGLGIALTDKKHLTLKEAGILYKCKHKKLETKEHGKITPKYINYNIEDTFLTLEVYLKMKEDVEKYGVDIPINKVYSSAALGKACLKQLGIKPFLQSNRNFPKKILGKQVAAYYGGRTEVKVRKTPTRVSVLDFTSMYPTLLIIMGLWDLITARKIKCVDVTSRVKTFLENIDLSELSKPETWKELVVLAKIAPKDDVLPVRMQYADENIFNIGINYLTSRKSLYYTLPDLIVSKLTTGEVPRIIKAIRFVSKGKQSLKPAKILGIKINPRKKNLFKFLIEKRHDFQTNGDYREKALKILVSSISYGIFLQIDERRLPKAEKVRVYSDKTFLHMTKKLELPGEFFNPIIGATITAGARLILGIVEALLKNHDSIYAFCDTDSMAIPPKFVKTIQNYFQNLNPYNFDNPPIFKEEKKNIWCYGISAKRYCLYDFDGKNFSIKEGDYKLHGLGHLSNPFGEGVKWEKMVWEDILRLHYKMMTEAEFMEKYCQYYAALRMAISTYSIYERFAKLNKNKSFNQKIKPFNFFLAGIGTGKDVKPISPFTKNILEAVHGEFINYKSGEVKSGAKYWKPLNEELWRFINHKDSKFDGDVGMMERKHIVATGKTYIGKEASNIEHTGVLDNADYLLIPDEEELKRRVLKMSYKEASKLGIGRSTLFYLKKRIREGKPPGIYKKTLEKLRMK